MRLKDYAVIALISGSLSQTSCAVFNHNHATQKQAANNPRLSKETLCPLPTDGTSKLRVDFEKKIKAALKENDLVITLTDNGSNSAIESWKNLNEAARQYIASTSKGKIKVINVHTENYPDFLGGEDAPDLYDIGVYIPASFSKGILQGKHRYGSYKEGIISAEAFLQLMKQHMPQEAKPGQPPEKTL